MFVPEDSYGAIIEDKMQEFLEKLCEGKKVWAPRELWKELGKELGEDSILYWCWRNHIPVIVPGPTDGAVGYNFGSSPRPTEISARSPQGRATHE
uniref:Uncharacterized protein n=1 Tax=Candidatus Caldatribacterium californiense TaxID=1454726 RepID=A0A7V3YN71_9BACT